MISGPANRPMKPPMRQERPERHRGLAALLDADAGHHGCPYDGA